MFPRGWSSFFSSSLGRRLQGLGIGALGLVYPRNCVGCETPLGARGRRWICEDCAGLLHRIAAPFCEVCGQSYDAEISRGSFRCGNCADLDLGFDFAVGAYRNEGLARTLIHRFKYRREHHLCALLGRMLGDVFDEERLAASRASGECWTVVPVPLHPRRLREREFNQSAELARVLCRNAAAAENSEDRSGAEIPTLKFANALRRVRYTPRQAQLDRAERLTNLKNAFALLRCRGARRLVEDRPVLLVDDVLTTGGTASECARVLRSEGGASKIVVITVVRG